MNETITLAHGSGGRQTSELIGDLFKKYFDNDLLTADDAAVLPRPEGRLSMSTDGFIVSPAEFPGGNIGKLSICGTVNDIACMGATPLYLTCAFVIEEGFEVARLERIVASMAETCKEVGVKIVAGDTKVAGKGQVDGVFITTTGIGVLPDDMHTGGACAQPGDCVIVTGDVGRHGCTILLTRNEFKIKADVSSDCAPLSTAVEAAMGVTHDLHVVRDATRGGVGTVLYEIADQAGVGVTLNAKDIPVDETVRGVCDMLGLNPLYLACEGRLVLVAPAEYADGLIAALKKTPYAKDAAVIGTITAENPGKVILNTEIGTKTILPLPGGELLPRIC